MSSIQQKVLEDFYPGIPFQPAGGDISGPETLASVSASEDYNSPAGEAGSRRSPATTVHPTSLVPAPQTHLNPKDIPHQIDPTQ